MARGKRAGARDVAPKLRAAFKRAILHWAGEREEVYEHLAFYADKGDTLTDIDAMEICWLTLLRADPKEALEVFARFVPREMLLEADGDDIPHLLSSDPMTPEEWIEQFGNPDPTPH